MAEKVENARIRVIVDGKLADTALRDLEASARKAKSELRSMSENDPKRKQLLKDFQDLNKEINKQRKDLNDTRTAWQRTTDSAKGFFVGTLGANLATGALSAVWSGFTNIINVQKEFESSLKNLSAITGLAGQDLKFMGDEALKLSMTSGVAARDIVEGYKLIASAKPELLQQKELLAAVTKETITLSKASGLDLPEAAKRLTDVMNQFALPGEEAGRIVNILAEGAKLGAAEVPEVSEAMLKFGVAANASNISVAESVALVEALADKGLKGAEAGTQLRNVLAKLSAPDTLPKQALDYLKQAGVNIDILKDKTIPFSARLEELGKITGNASALTEVFGLENKNAAQVLLENRNRVKDLTDALNKDGLNSAMEQAETNTDTLASAQTKLSTTWDAVMTKQGGISQFFGTLIKWLTNAIVQFDNFGAVLDIWGNKLSFGLAKISDDTYKAAIENDAAVQKMLSKYSSMSDIKFLKGADEFRKEFVANAVKDGESMEEADRLFGIYIMKRRQMLIDAAKSKKAAGAGPQTSGPGSAADLVIDRYGDKEKSDKPIKPEDLLENQLAEIKKKTFDREIKDAEDYGKRMLMVEQQNYANRKITKEEFELRQKEIAMLTAQEQLAIAQAYGVDALKFETDFITAKGDINQQKYQTALQAILDENAIADARLQKLRDDAMLQVEIEATTEEDKNMRLLDLEISYEEASYNIKLQAMMAEMELMRTNGVLTVAEENKRNAEIAALKLAHFQRITGMRQSAATMQMNAEAAEAQRSKQLINDWGNAVTNVMQVIGANAETVTAFQKMTALMQIAIDTATAIGSIIKYAAADPKNALTGGIDIPLKIAAGVLTVSANMMKAKQILDPAPPKAPTLQGFMQGGYTGSGNGMLDANGNPIAGLVHANEYVINPNQMRDPSVMNILPMLEANRKFGTPVVMPGTNTEKIIERTETVKDMGLSTAMAMLAEAVKAPAKFEIDDEAAFKISKRITEFAERDAYTTNT